jgi:hypothetical protein
LGVEALNLQEQLTATDQGFALAAGLQGATDLGTGKQRTEDFGHHDPEIEDRVSGQPEVGGNG